MAVKYSNKPNFAPEKMMSFDKSFSRMNGQPLDPTEVWYDYIALANYAKTAEAYVGQKVTYVDTAENKTYHYVIVGEGENSTLENYIPTNVSELINDSGLATEDYVDSSLEGFATEDYVDNAVADLVNAAPTLLNTLDELAAALGDDPNFATTVATQIGEISAALEDKADTGDIPTNISELTNDSGYLTAAITVKENGNTTQIPIGCVVFEVSEDGTTLNITTSAAL